MHSPRFAAVLLLAVPQVVASQAAPVHLATSAVPAVSVLWPPPSPPPGRFVDVGGYRLHLDCTGGGAAPGGPTVVLLAGAGDFASDWGPVQAAAARTRRTCSYDRAGVGWSDPGPTPRTMRQDAAELRALLRAAGEPGPYVLVGHSVGGLIARVYAAAYPDDVAGLVLVDPTHENTTLNYRGRVVRMRDQASAAPVPPVQTLRTSPPAPPAAADVEQAALNRQVFGPPRIEPPFDRLSPAAQAIRLWFLDQPPRAAARPDFWAEELRDLAAGADRGDNRLGALPLVVVLPAPEAPSAAPPGAGMSDSAWQANRAAYRRDKEALAALSTRGRVVVAPTPGHHVQLEAPAVVADAIRAVTGGA